MTRKMRKFVLLAHILSAVSWIGVDLVMGVLSFRGLSTDDPQTLATAYGGLAMFCVPLLLTLGLLTLTTGVVLGLGTRFGLVRYWWVVTKLVITLAFCVLILVALQPTLADAATQTALVDETLPTRLADVRRNMIFPPIVSTSMLLFASWLSVFKPWGVTSRGRRFLRVRGPERKSPLPAVSQDWNQSRKPVPTHRSQTTPPPGGEPGPKSLIETSPQSPLYDGPSRPQQSKPGPAAVTLDSMDHTGAGDPDFMARAQAEGEALGAALRAVEESMKGHPVHDVEDRLIDELRARGAFMSREEIQHHALVISDPEGAIRNPEGLENLLARIHDPDRAQEEAEVEAQLGHTLIRLTRIVESMWRVRRTAVSARRTMDGVEFEIRIDPWSRRRADKLTRAVAPAAVSVVPFQKPPSK